MSVIAGTKYVLINVEGNNALDLSLADNASVIGWPVNRNNNQQWLLQHNGASWTFQSVETGTFLAPGCLPAIDGTRLSVSSCPYIWDIWPDEQDSSTLRIFVPKTSFNIDLSDHGNPNGGIPVVVWSKWSGRNQTWRFEPVSA